MFRASQVNFYVQDIEASVSFYRDLISVRGQRRGCSDGGWIAQLVLAGRKAR